MRLDIYLTQKGFYKSRARAAAAIAAGCVQVDGNVVLKNSFTISAGALVECMPDPVPYVSRGGLKLAGALAKFEINVQGCSCLDIGSSTGGFTHVLLERGADHVTCVDVGHDQLDPILVQDSRVTVFEGTDARTFRPGVQYDFICMDVSFISVLALMETVQCLLNPNGQAVILIKPQFELGRSALNKNGIVKSKEAGRRRAEEIVKYFTEMGNFRKGVLMESPIQGGDGNTEYCAWFGAAPKIV